MTLLDGGGPLADAWSGPASGWYGVHVAVVTDNQDPSSQGRVKVKLPWSPDSGSESYETWARVATLMAGPDRGTWFVPDPDDEVLVAFEAGEPSRPVVLGSLWNGSDSPPESMGQDNPKRTILTKAGVRITLDDSQGSVSLLLETPGGQRVHLEDNPATVTAEDANGNLVTMAAAGVTVVAAVEVKIQAITAKVEAGMVTVDAALSKFSGVVQADTVLTNTIVAATYMPGAGNIW